MTSTTSVSSSTGTISSAGIGSGLDVDSIVTQLMAVESQPLTAMQAKSTAIGTKISAFGSITSALSSLSDAVTTLATASTWTGKTVSSSNSDAVDVSVSSGDSASASSFSVSVTQLAQAQSTASNAVATGSGVGSGSLSIQIGTWDTSGSTPSFTAGSKAAVSVSIAKGDSIATIASKINKAGAGVTATVLHDISGDRLLVRSSTTGEASGFRIQSTDDGTDTTDVGLSTLAFDPASSSTTGMAANTIQYAANAKATINGISVASATNTLTDTIPGLTLTLSQVTTTPVEITAASDTDSMTTAINNFVSAYNAANELMNTDTAYDASTSTAAVLQGDSTTVSLQNAMRSLIGQISGGGTFQRLSDIGVQIAKDGAGDLTVNSTTLAAALQDPASVGQFFSAPTGTSNGTTGFATRFATFTQGAIGTGGILPGTTASLQSQKTQISKDEDSLQDRLTLTEARLRKQYTDLDTTMATLTSLNTYVTQQIAAWNKSTS